MGSVIRVENLSKQYRLGEISTGAITHDINRWWHKIRGKENPYLKIGEANDRTEKGNSDYVWSLRDINFEIQQGDAVGIIGRNGAGKSTLLKILSKVTQPTTGTIKTKGRIASLLEVGTGFHPELSGRDNIFLNGAILGMRKAEIKRKFDEIVDFAGVERYIDTPVKRYSSGMYVRLAFAVAAYLESEILIVDEVLAVGDAEFQKKCLGKMGEVSKGEGRTVLFVSHNINSIRTLCNSGILLKNGQLFDGGDIEKVINNYSKIYQNFGGNTNFLNQNLNPENNINILSALISPPLRETLSTFDTFDAITINVKYRVNTIVRGSIINFLLYKLDQLIFSSFDTDANPELLNERIPGVYQTNVTIPAGILKPGNYQLSVGAGIANSHAIEQYDSCICFEISLSSEDEILKSYAEKRPGIVAQKLSWNITKIY